MQQIDRAAIETIGIPRLLLMEHAGLAVARAVHTITPPPAEILLCCGSGFNGGDGLCAARHLEHQGYGVRVLLAGALGRLREEPAVYATILQRLGVPMLEVGGESASRASTVWEQVERWLAGCQVVVDALLGIGAAGPVREPMASLIPRLNRAGKPVVAVDIPSGLDGDTGRAFGVAVKASMTVTFGLPKQGCLVGEGPGLAGTLVVDSITIPRRFLNAPAA